LHHTAPDLALDEHRIDHRAAILSDREVEKLDKARLQIDRYNGTVCRVGRCTSTIRATTYAERVGSFPKLEDQMCGFAPHFRVGDHQVRLNAAEHVLCNVGAYSSFPITCGVEPFMALADLPGPYRVPEYRARARGVASNTCPMAPYRGVSRPVITAAMERLMDCAAVRLGLDTLEIRRRNLIAEFPHTSVTGVVHDPGSYREAMEAAARVVDLAQFRARQEAARAEGCWLGLGISVFAERTGPGTPAFAARRMVITPGRVTCSDDT
jgi:Molybdopterin-binding domain of aldehyde dehydrogenase